MTDGSLRTIPRPRSYTSVLAVPRSIARSRATSGASALVVARRERPHLTLEVVDARLHSAGLARLEGGHREPDRGDHHGDGEEHQGAHGVAPLTSDASTRCWASRPQLSPPSQDSRFQMGTEALSASMQNRAAANASPRCGADATTSTADSPTGTGPVRCSIAIRPTDAQRARAST